MLCIGLTFCTNQNAVSIYCVDTSSFCKRHHIVIYCKIVIRLALPSKYVKQITVKQMFKIFKNLLKTLIGEKLLNSFL